MSILTSLTLEQEVFIRLNYRTMFEREIAKTLNISRYQVQAFKREAGLSKNEFKKDVVRRGFRKGIFNIKEQENWLV